MEASPTFFCCYGGVPWRQSIHPFGVMEGFHGGKPYILMVSRRVSTEASPTPFCCSKGFSWRQALHIFGVTEGFHEASPTTFRCYGGFPCRQTLHPFGIMEGFHYSLARNYRAVAKKEGNPGFKCVTLGPGYDGTGGKIWKNCGDTICDSQARMDYGRFTEKGEMLPVNFVALWPGTVQLLHKIRKQWP